MKAGGSAGDRPGYKGFGSFHSDNVEELIGLPDDLYVPPDLPIRWDDLLPAPGPAGQTDTAGDGGEPGALPQSVFGHPFRDAHFLLDPEWTFVNHGAFGAPLRLAVEAGNRWRLHNARQPLRFVDRQLFPLIVWALRKLAAEVNAAPNEVAFVPNATTGLNTVIKSIRLREGDEVYMLNIGYGSVKKMLAHKCQQVGAHVREADITFPRRGVDDILEVVKNTLRPNTRLAIFDHITSNTGLTMPIAELIEICHSRGVPVFIDGAHGMGSVPLDLTTLGADYYVSNCHKWLCCAPGCAFLYVRSPRGKVDQLPLQLAVMQGPETQAPAAITDTIQSKGEHHSDTIEPLIISHGFGEGFTSNFIWSGYHDYSAILSFPLVLEFWKRLGWERVWQYNTQLLNDAVSLLQQRWQSKLLAPLTMHRMMALVGVPDAVVASGNPTSATSTDAKLLQDALHYKYRVEVPIKCIQGRLYVRISAHAYNQISDYERLADVVLDLVQNPSQLHMADSV